MYNNSFDKFIGAFLYRLSCGDVVRNSKLVYFNGEDLEFRNVINALFMTAIQTLYLELKLFGFFNVIDNEISILSVQRASNIRYQKL